MLGRHSVEPTLLAVGYRLIQEWISKSGPTAAAETATSESSAG